MEPQSIWSAGDTRADSQHESPYESPEARRDALRLGLWVFLGSETLLFAGLFGLYAAYRSMYADSFARASRLNEQWIGSVNTFVLIVSSFFAAWAVHAARARRAAQTRWALAGVIALGVTFLGFKALEYGHHLTTGIAPGVYYAHAALPEHGAHVFFTLYYFMTGLHALHVIAGLVVMAWLFLRVRGAAPLAERDIEIELGALYWHLVDIVWIFLWPLLYLIA